MDKFYNIVLLILSWLFLASAICVLVFFLSLNNGEMREVGPAILGLVPTSLFFAALAWVARKASLYINSKSESSEDKE